LLLILFYAFCESKLLLNDLLVHSLISFWLADANIEAKLSSILDPPVFIHQS